MSTSSCWILQSYGVSLLKHWEVSDAANLARWKKKMAVTSQSVHQKFNKWAHSSHVNVSWSIWWAQKASRAWNVCGRASRYSFASVQFSHSVVSDSLQPHELQHARPRCPSPTPEVHPNPCPLCRWCHPTTSSSVVPSSSCPQSFPASGSFQISQLFASGGQSIGASASASLLPMNIQDWFPLGWTGWISLQSKRLSRVLSNTTVQKIQFFGAQLSSQSNSNIHTWLWEKP